MSVVVDDQYILRIYHDLSNMDVELDPDPLALGPNRMNAKISYCRKHLTRCQQIYLQISRDQQILQRALRGAKLDLDLRMQDLLTNDPEVRSGRSVRDREAAANVKLRAELEAISTLEISLGDLASVSDVVRAKQNDLKDIQGRLRDQIKICQEELGLGRRWSTPSVNLEPSPVDAQAAETVGQITSGSEASLSDLELFVQAECGQDTSLQVEDSVSAQQGQTVAEPIVTEAVTLSAPVKVAQLPESATDNQITSFFNNFNPDETDTKESELDYDILDLLASVS